MIKSRPNGKVTKDSAKRILGFLRMDYDGPLQDMPLSGQRTLSAVAGLFEQVEALTKRVRAAESMLAAAERRLDELERRHHRGGKDAGTHTTSGSGNRPDAARRAQGADPDRSL